jgi:1-acyl-sn-glycerol-3-phosphate acyltransferase
VTEWVYRAVIRTALGLFRLLGFRFSIEGEEHVPAVGGAVLASNHVSYFDFMFVGLAAHPKRRFVRFMAKKSVFDSPVAGPLMRGMHHIPVDRSAGASSYAVAVRALAAGELVGVFPESTISRSFVPRAVKTGAARMAIESGAPLLPIVTWGGQQVWTAGRRPRWKRRVPVVIRVGPAVPVTPGTTVPQLTERLHATLTAMARDVQQSYPAPTEVGDDWWQPAYLGGTAPTPEAATAIERDAIAGRLARRATNRRSRLRPRSRVRDEQKQ